MCWPIVLFLVLYLYNVMYNITLLDIYIYIYIAKVSSNNWVKWGKVISVRKKVFLLSWWLEDISSSACLLVISGNSTPTRCRDMPITRFSLSYYWYWNKLKRRLTRTLIQIIFNGENIYFIFFPLSDVLQLLCLNSQSLREFPDG